MSRFLIRSGRDLRVVLQKSIDDATGLPRGASRLLLIRLERETCYVNVKRSHVM